QLGHDARHFLWVKRRLELAKTASERVRRPQWNCRQRRLADRATGDVAAINLFLPQHAAQLDELAFRHLGDQLLPELLILSGQVPYLLLEILPFDLHVVDALLGLREAFAEVEVAEVCK